MSRWIDTNHFAVKKAGSSCVTPITVAAAVAGAVTGDLAALLTLSLVEPTVQAIVGFFHERAWGSVAKNRAAAADLATPATV